MKPLASRLLVWFLSAIIFGIVVFTFSNVLGVCAWAGCSEQSDSSPALDAPTQTVDSAPDEEAKAEDAVAQQASTTPTPSRSEKVQVNCTKVKWGKQTFELPWINHGGAKLYRIDDVEVQNLCTQVGCQLSRAFLGDSLMASSAQRRVLLHPGAETMRVDGVDKPVKGVLVVKDGDYYVDGQLLWFMLAMQAKRQGDTVVLKQVMFAPKFVNEGQGRCLIISAAGTMQYEEMDTEDGAKVYTIINTVWPEEQQSFDSEDLHVSFANTPEGNVKATVKCMEGWLLYAHKGLRPNELVVDLVNTYPKPAEVCSLASIDQREDEAEATTLGIVGDGGYWYHWLFDAQTRILRVDMVGMATNKSGEVSSDVSGLKSVRLSSVGEAGKPITRLTAVVQEGYALEIESPQESVGELTIRVAPGAYYESLYDEGFTLGYTFAKGIIVIDPGHGGGDPGARNQAMGLKEKTINLDVALRLRAALEQLGWTVVMTRENDVDVSWRNSPDKVELQARCDVANDVEAMLFISLHCNASTSPSANGSSIYWYKRVDRDFAEALNGALGSALGVSDIGVLREGFYVLRHTNMPSVLVEIAFLSNPHDAKLLRQETFRQRVADNLAQAVEEYYQ